MTTPIYTPRLRMTRLPLNYDHNTQVASTSHTGGPSRLTEFSQLLDVDLNNIELPDPSDHSNNSKITTHSTATQSEKPAAVLRALLSRLPADRRSPTPSQQCPSERESDYEISEIANATPSMAQESLKDIFFKARRDPGNTPQKAQARRNSVDASEVNFSIQEERKDYKGKRRSLSDDETEHLDKALNRRATRFKASPQPVTMEFLRERFDSQIAHTPDKSSPSIHNSSNDAATLWLNLNSSHATPPAATSTPQQSLRMSVNSEFQSNLLDQDTEMQHAIEDSVFYGHSSDHLISPPPTVRNRANLNLAESHPSSSDETSVLHQTPRESNSKRDINWSKPHFTHEGPRFSAHSHSNPSPASGEETELSHIKSRGPSSLEFGSLRRHNYSPRDNDRTLALQKSQTRLELTSSKGARLSPIPHEGRHRRSSFSSSRPSSPAVSTQSHDEAGDFVRERERNWNSPHPTWHDHTSGHTSSNPPAPPKPRAFSPTVSLNLTETGYKPSTRSLSPFPLEQISPSPSPSQTSSLDNIHRHRDVSLRHPSRTPSPLLSFSKKKLSSPNKSMTSTEPTVPAKTCATPKHSPSPSFDQPSQAITPPSWRTQTHILSTKHVRKSISSSSIVEGQNKSGQFIQEVDTDDLRETDFSQSDVHGTEIDEAHSHSTQPPMGITTLSIPLDASQNLPEDRTTPHDGFGQSPSPSTPSRSSTPHAPRREFKTPSPPKGLPDLPAPSSSDESEPKPWKQANNPVGAKRRHDYAWSATPKPPGGWLQTPGPSGLRLDQTEPDLGGRSTISSPTVIDEIPHDLTTPARAAHATAQQSKTPKPPGGWLSTPTPAYSLVSPQPEKAQGLLTPVPSFSKASAIDSKTPGVPGGWMMTPLARKSILKVRFNPETPTNPSGRQTPEDSLGLVSTAAQSPASTSSRLEALPVTPRSPRKSNTPQTPSIRVVDAFGREQESNMSTEVDTNRNRKALRVVDAMGQEIQETDGMAMQDSEIVDFIQPSSRAELVSRIRRGLDDLAGDLDDIDDDDGSRTADHDRIAELNAISIQARGNRERLHGKKLPIDFDALEHQNSVFPDSRSYFRINRRVYFIVLFLQLFAFLFMYQLSVKRARELFLNSYYDPFNPELHLYIFKYDTSASLTDSFISRPDQTIREAFLQTGGKVWYDWLSLMGHMQNYVWKVWKPEAIAQNSVWSPT